MTTKQASPRPWPFKLPVKALRSWEGYYEPEDDERARYMAQPYTRITDADGEEIVTAHDLFTFKPGQAEAIVTAVNSYAAMREALNGLLDIHCRGSDLEKFIVNGQCVRPEHVTARAALAAGEDV